MLVLDRLAGEVVPAPDQHGRGKAEAPRSLDHVRLRAAEKAARDDQDGVDAQLVDLLDEGFVRRDQLLEVAEGASEPRVHPGRQLEVGRPFGDAVRIGVADELQQASGRPPARPARVGELGTEVPSQIGRGAAGPPPTRPRGREWQVDSRDARRGGRPAARPAASRTPGPPRSRAARRKAPGGASREGRWRRPAGAATGFPSANRIGRRRPRLDLEAFPAASAAGGADGRDTKSGQHGLLEAERMSAVTEQGPRRTPRVKEPPGRRHRAVQARRAAADARGLVPPPADGPHGHAVHPQALPVRPTSAGSGSSCAPASRSSAPRSSSAACWPSSTASARR